MNQTQLIEDVAKRTGITIADATLVVRATFDSIAYSVSKGSPVMVTNFGTFRLHKSPVTTRRNPTTGDTFRSGLRTPKFRASGKFRELVKSGRVVKTVAKDPKSY